MTRSCLVLLRNCQPLRNFRVNANAAVLNPCHNGVDASWITEKNKDRRMVQGSLSTAEKRQEDYSLGRMVQNS